MNVIKITRKLVSFNTVEDKQNNEIVSWIKQYLEFNGFKCKEIINKETKKKCLIAKFGKDPILAFSGHLDTVYPAEEWNGDPFKIRIQDGKMYGLGVCDMKGGIAAFLKAIAEIDKTKIKNGLKLYFTYDEETNFEGIDLLTKNEENFPKYLIVSEPTDLEPVFATKGCMEMKVTFYGKSTHSSTPNKGKNAIVECLKFVDELIKLSEELKCETNENFSIPYTTINIGKIKGGEAVNVVPDKCSIKFDARTIKKEHNVLIKKRLEEILKKYDCKFQMYIDINAKLNQDNDMIETIEEITGNKRRTENFVTEASFIENSSAIILGVGPVNAHQCDEYIEIKKLNELVRIYKKIIKKYCF